MSLAVSDIEEVVRTVLFRNIALGNRVSELEAKMRKLEAEKAGLELAKAALESSNAKLELRVGELQRRLAGVQVPEKDSHNSSIPRARRV